jgi:energy-coupling factor transporter ATP-binding protein EcfA2
VLVVSGISKKFGGITAARNLGFSIEAGEIVSLIGPNGAGKTTVFNMITGFVKPSEGVIEFKGRDITGWQPQRIAREGILVDPPVSGPGRANYPTPLSWYVDSIRLSLAGVRAEELRPYSPTWSDYHLQVRAEWLHTCNEEAIVKTYRGFHEENIQDDLPYVQAPTTLIAAGRGGVIADTDIAEFKRLMPKVDVVRMHNAGHMVPWDDFEGFFAELKKILPAVYRGGY